MNKLSRAELYWRYRRAALRDAGRLHLVAAPEGFRLAAVLVPVIEHEHSLHVILTRRASHLRNHAGQISFPGGRVEDGDASPLAAALREAEEEIGLRPNQCDVLGPLPPRPTPVSRFHILPFLVFVNGYQIGPHDQGEVSEVFCAPLQHVLDPAQHIPHETLWQGEPHRYHEMFWRDYRIWGATADMLVTLSHWLQPADIPARADLLSGPRANLSSDA